MGVNRWYIVGRYLTLARELLEEANATLLQSVKMGVQKSVNSEGEQSFQAFYWCRVIVNNDFSPQHEITERRLVTPDMLLDTLFWGRTDPKAAILLNLAMEIEQSQK